MVLYFYSLLSYSKGQHHYCSGTFEKSKEIANGDEFSNVVKELCELNDVDRSKTVVTAFNRI